MFGIYVILVLAIILAIKFCKKVVRTVVVSIFGLVLLYSIALGADIQRANSLEEPIFVIRDVSADDGGSYSAKGLFYDVIVEKNIDGEVERVELTMFGKVVAASIT